MHRAVSLVFTLCLAGLVSPAVGQVIVSNEYENLDAELALDAACSGPACPNVPGVDTHRGDRYGAVLTVDGAGPPAAPGIF